jgi:cytochrome bd ubiquinol oxidase subunit I
MKLVHKQNTVSGIICLWTRFCCTESTSGSPSPFTFHYLFPQLTMGLALLIVVMKTIALRTGNERYNEAARFWAKIFAINFLIGVVTGIPMEFQFGTNWSQFSRFTGGVIGQPLAMEGVFSFSWSRLFWDCFYSAKSGSRPGHTGERHFLCGWDRGSSASSLS